MRVCKLQKKVFYKKIQRKEQEKRENEGEKGGYFKIMPIK